MEYHNLFDLLVILFILASAFFAFSRGFFQEIFSLFSWSGALLISYFYSKYLIDYVDNELQFIGSKFGSYDYEEALNSGDPDFNWLMPSDEWDAITVNYTSGTTGDPKGVVYHHRGAYLLAQ